MSDGFEQWWVDKNYTSGKGHAQAGWDARDDEIAKLKGIITKFIDAFEGGNGDGLFTSEDIDLLEQAREASKDE